MHEPFCNPLFIPNLFGAIYTPGRRQSKTFLRIVERGSKLSRNSVDWRQIAIENTVKAILIRVC